MGKHSLAKDFRFKASSSFVSVFFLFIQHAIAARLLGPLGYGNFNFLKSFFEQFSGLFDSGALLGLYTKLSQRPNDGGLKRFYWLLILGISGVSGVILLLTFVAKIDGKIWVGQDRRYVVLAFGFGVVVWASQVVGKMVDAHGLTVKGELWKIKQRMISTLTIVLLFLAGSGGLGVFFTYQILMFVLLAFGLMGIMNREGLSVFGERHLKKTEARVYGQEFWKYNGPLMVYGGVGFLMLFGDRWLLQTFWGSMEQGYYSLAYQMALGSFLITSSMTPLIMRDFSKAYGLGDMERVKTLFRKVVPLFFAMQVYFCLFLSFNAKTLALIFGGENFIDGSAVIALMMLYPIHQTYGQLSGSLYYAMGRTKLYRNTGIVGMAIGLPLSVWLIVPKSMGGLGMGAQGLAIKMLIYQSFTVNLQLFYNARTLGLSFTNMLFYQIRVIGLIGGVGYLCHKVMLPFEGGNVFLLFIVEGALYTGACMALILMTPQLIGLRGEELRAWVKRFETMRRRSKFFGSKG